MPSWSRSSPPSPRCLPGIGSAAAPPRREAARARSLRGCAAGGGKTRSVSGPRGLEGRVCGAVVAARAATFPPREFPARAEPGGEGRGARARAVRGPPPGRPPAGARERVSAHGFSALRLRRDFGYIRALSGRGEAHLTAAILDAPWRRTGAYFRRPAKPHRG